MEKIKTFKSFIQNREHLFDKKANKHFSFKKCLLNPPESNVKLLLSFDRAFNSKTVLDFKNRGHWSELSVFF